jgi:diguanylate cyclase (GGDEF)-like protein
MKDNSALHTDTGYFPASSLGGERAMELLVKRVLDTLADLGQSEKVALFSIEQEARQAIVSGGFMNGEFSLPGRQIDYAGTPLEDIIKSKEAATYPGCMFGALPFPAYQDSGAGFECLCLPLLSEEKEVLGIAVLSQQIGVAQPDFRMQMLGMLRSLVSAAMENARLFQLATLDSLTGLYVRRYFEVRLQEELVRVRRYGKVTTLLMADIDYFKKVNDTHGHQQGDKVLESVATVLRNSVRHEIDLPCRYGGEEFIVLLPNTDVVGATILAERIRQRCAELVFTTDQGSLLQVTISLGLAEMTQATPLSRDEFISRADSMLYAAKLAGRNCVRVYGDDALLPVPVKANEPVSAT